MADLRSLFGELVELTPDIAGKKASRVYLRRPEISESRPHLNLNFQNLSQPSPWTATSGLKVFPFMFLFYQTPCRTVRVTTICTSYDRLGYTTTIAAQSSLRSWSIKYVFENIS